VLVEVVVGINGFSAVIAVATDISILLTRRITIFLVFILRGFILFELSSSLFRTYNLVRSLYEYRWAHLTGQL
jgi:hypothetical protein